MIIAVDPAPVLAVRRAVDDHVAAELSSDPDRIAASLSSPPFFPTLVRDVGGRAALQLITDDDEVGAFYRNRLGTFEIVDTTRVVELRTDWYALHESVATVRHVGDYLGIAATGHTHQVHSVVLFPVDGRVVGELEWTHVDFSRIFAGTPTATADGDSFIPTTRLATAAVHDHLLDAWIAGDVEAVSALSGPIPWASRHAHADRLLPDLCSAAAGAGLTEAGAAFVGIDVIGSPQRLQRVAASWYSFVEATVQVGTPTGPRSIRIASLLAMDDGRPAGHLAYSVDTAGTGSRFRPDHDSSQPEETREDH